MQGRTCQVAGPKCRWHPGWLKAQLKQLVALLTLSSGASEKEEFKKSVYFHWYKRGSWRNCIWSDANSYTLYSLHQKTWCLCICAYCIMFVLKSKGKDVLFSHYTQTSQEVSVSLSSSLEQTLSKPTECCRHQKVITEAIYCLES